MRERLIEAVLAGSELDARELTQALLAEGVSARVILDETLVPAIRRAGDLWEQGEFFIPELMQASTAMKGAMSLLRPRLGAAGDSAGATVVIGTIEGDIHDIGKTLVAGMLEAAGHNVVDLGADVAPARFAEEASRSKASLICVSALLTTTMLNQQKVIEERNRAGLAHVARVMVGGAPVSRAWADRIGAEGYAPDAFSAVDEAARLLSLSR
ncbi:MAG: corrinoid protein [Candidatus Eisenbacteria bacterium]|jgi:methanogenic corrinoid protein MtbC1|nr:corrinoid protein [Candidatus Eisenbacteria bacterium]